MIVSARVFITGDVIGVGFRYWTIRKAKSLALFGWVKNIYEPIKGVEAVFQGDKKNVEEMIDLCKKGPLVSLVENVEIKWQKGIEEFNGFKILK